MRIGCISRFNVNSNISSSTRSMKVFYCHIRDEEFKELTIIFVHFEAWGDYEKRWEYLKMFMLGNIVPNISWYSRDMSLDKSYFGGSRDEMVKEVVIFVHISSIFVILPNISSWKINRYGLLIYFSIQFLTFK